MNRRPSKESRSSAYGFQECLSEQEEAIGLLRVQLAGDPEDGSPGRAMPIRIDSARGCVSAYVSAIDLVQSRFWTTTFFTSGFWVVRDPRILEANRRLLDRLRHRPGAVRRLFVLDQSPDQTIRAYQEHRTLLDRLNRTDELRRLDTEFENLLCNLRTLDQSGCELKVVHDLVRTGRGLPREMEWDDQDCELALYDEFRMDVFEGGRTGHIQSLRGYCPDFVHFEDIFSAGEKYFDELWRQGQPMRGFVERLQAGIEASKCKIHYRANWLARYEFALDADDVELKLTEAQWLCKVVKREGRWGRIASYLDIGTCTGRYPLMLSEAVDGEGRIVGLDDDAECIEFARANAQRQVSGDARFCWVRADFTGRDALLDVGSFELITCMMSTLSHFGRDRKQTFEDTLQASLLRMKALLVGSGLLILTTWSEPACREQNFLSIYDELDRARLAAWTPGVSEVRARLKAAGFVDVQLDERDSRLCLWVCHAGRK